MVGGNLAVLELNAIYDNRSCYEEKQRTAYTPVPVKHSLPNLTIARYGQLPSEPKPVQIKEK